MDTELQMLLEDDTTIEDYWYYENLRHRTILIKGELDIGVLETIILPLKKMENENPKEPIKILLHSIGGSVWDSLVICNLIDAVKCPVVVEVLGYAMSMAMYILMAGYNNPNVHRVCHPFSSGLIHAGSVELAGDAKKVKQVQKFNDRTDEAIKNYVLTHSKISQEEYELHEDEEWYLTADDMLKYGLVDEILPDEAN